MSPSPSRTGALAARLVVLAVALVYQCGWVLLAGHRPDLGHVSRAGLATRLGVPFTAAALALAGAIRAGVLGLGESWRRVGVLLAASAAIFGVGTVVTGTADAQGAVFWSQNANCMRITCALASVPLVLGVWAFRHSFAVSSRWHGACLGTAAGALAATTMRLICPNDGLGHVLLAHGIMMVVGAVAGAVFGERVMRA
jgi:hypothetical protein